MAFCPEIETRLSGSDAVVIIEHSTEALASMHGVRAYGDWPGLHEPVFETLRVALSLSSTRADMGQPILFGGGG